MATRLLRLPAVLQRTGLSRSTVYVPDEGWQIPTAPPNRCSRGRLV